jgi:hypothetical protein
MSKTFQFSKHLTINQEYKNLFLLLKILKQVLATVSYHISSRYTSAFAKFRCGVAPLRIETGRYENKIVNERVCFICHEQIEDEKHALLVIHIIHNHHNIYIV